MAIAPKRSVRRVDGILLLDKPDGLSSNAALQRAKRLYAARKAGHAGTLDPLATGLLPVCFGEATKFVQGLLDAAKRYRATIRFGEATTTGDAEGGITETADVAFDRARLEQALAGFVGTIAQVPPIYSALKRDGRPYYAYARAGQDIARVARNVEIASLELVDWTPPEAIVDVECSKGTYIRVLAEDVGRTLGSCAHIAALRRTGVGTFDVRDATPLDRIEAIDIVGRDRLLRPVDAAIAGLPRVDVDVATAAALRRGQSIPAPDGAGSLVRAYDAAGVLIGVLQRDGTRLKPRRLSRIDD